MIHRPELTQWRTKLTTAALAAALAAGVSVPYDGPVAVEARFYVKKPQRCRSRLFERFAATRPDLDKLQRALGDALAPAKNALGVLAEDSRIVKWDSEKRYAASADQQRAEVTIRLLGDDGDGE